MNYNMIQFILAAAQAATPVLEVGQLVLFYLPGCKYNGPYLLHLDRLQATHRLNPDFLPPVKLDCEQEHHFCAFFNFSSYPVFARLTETGY